MNIHEEINKAEQEKLEGLNPYSVNVIVDHIGAGLSVIPRIDYDQIQAGPEEVAIELNLVGPFMGDVDEFNNITNDERWSKN